MAASDEKAIPITQEQQDEQMLKYLGFVHAAAIQAVVYFSRLYGYAKDNSGPLKTGVESVEGTVKTVVRPVYFKFHDVPFELLKFADRKVDESLHGMEHWVPPAVKEASTQAFAAAQKAPEVAQSVVGEVHRAGVVGAAAGMARSAYARCEPAAKDLYVRYEPAAERCAASAWRSLNRLPHFPQVAQVVVPAAAYWTERYNQAVSYSADHGYAFSSYLPIVPTERIAKVFSDDGAAAADVPVEAAH